MKDLINNLKEIKKIDKNNCLESIKAMEKQLLAAWQETKKIKIWPDCKKVKNIVIAGMGGSALGGRVVKSLFESELKIPLFINTEYQLPEFVNKNSLVIVASYSGNTEETLFSFNDALRRKAKIFIITTDGKLGKRINRKKSFGLIFSPQFNFLGFPKTAIGYSIGFILGILVRLGYIKLQDKNFMAALDEFKKLKIENSAKTIALNLKGKIGVFIASGHLKGAVHAFCNQINEIAHGFSVHFDLPEMNHHLVEAFTSPKKLKKNFAYYFFNSCFYDQKVTKRYPLTRKILNKLKVSNFGYQLKSRSKLTQALELVNLGGLTAFYLSILKKEDPGPEPWIIYFKDCLKNINKGK